MYASTERERDEWIGQIGRAIVKNSGMYVEEGDEEDDDNDDLLPGEDRLSSPKKNRDSSRSPKRK